MHFFEYHYENVITYDLLNKFQYKNIEQLPKLQKIVLNIKCKNSDLKELISALVALEVITSQKAVVTKSKTSNISLKIRKGNPTGCKLTLRKTLMYKFFSKLILHVFPNIKQFEGFSSQKLKNIFSSFSFELKKIFFFSELENQYQFFNKLPNLQIVIVTNSTTLDELLFLLRSFKFPVSTL